LSTQKLKHQKILHSRSVVTAPNNSPLKETRYEIRGVRVYAREIFKDAALTIAAAKLQRSAADNYVSLFEAANKCLNDEGERDFLSVIDQIDNLKNETSAANHQELDDVSFAAWAGAVAERKGSLSTPAIAAEFLRASDHLHRRLPEDPQLREAIYTLAQAWHWLAFEVEGDHELATQGLRSHMGLVKGPERKQQIAAVRKDIIEKKLSAWRDQLLEAGKTAAARSAKAAAGDLIESVNKLFKQMNLKPIKMLTLERTIRQILFSNAAPKASK
jgi:hypothetical protein